MGQGWEERRREGPVGEQPSRAAGHPLLFERVLPLHSPSQLGVSPSKPRRLGGYSRVCGASTAKRPAATGYAVAGPAQRATGAPPPGWAARRQDPLSCAPPILDPYTAARYPTRSMPPIDATTRLCALIG